MTTGKHEQGIQLVSDNHDYILTRLSEAKVHFSLGLGCLLSAEERCLDLIKKGDFESFCYFLDCKFLLAMIKEIKVYLRDLMTVH